MASLRPTMLKAVFRGKSNLFRGRSLQGAQMSDALSPPLASRRRVLQSAHSYSSSAVSLEATAESLVGTSTSTSEEATDDTPHPVDIKYAFTPPSALSAESQTKVDELFDKILWLDMIEVHLLTQLVHELMGGKWSDLESTGGPIKTAAATAAPVEAEAENALKDVKLVGFDAKAKIKVIKEVRAVAGLGLKEAKEMVESVPKVIQKGLSPDKAEELKAQLEAVGAQVEIA